MKNNDFMNKRLTKDAGEAFSPARYSLKSRNDAIISPYKTYELFFEITFMVIQKLGAYEDIGIPDECMEAMRTARACNAQYLDDIKNPLEPGEYVLVSFENEGLTLPDIGRYETEDDESGAFYPEDHDYSYASFGIFVNAWMPLPKVYRGEE
jgi:hypothetical protein